MPKSIDNYARKEIGLRVRAAREKLPGDLGQLKEFADLVGISDSMLSAIESGQRALPAECLRRISQHTGVTPGEILNGSEEPHKPVHPYERTGEFLRQVRSLGVESLLPDRDSALVHLVSFAKEMYGGQVCITGSSLKGFQQDSNHEFVTALGEFAEARPNVQIRLIMTHPVHGYTRESLENRTRGSIVTEIFQGIRWTIDRLHVSPENIRLMKASPTCCTVFLQEGAEGIGLINPYPMMRQAFNCFSLIVRRVSESVLGGRAQSIYQSYYLANFDAPWNDRTGTITVPLQRGLEECLSEAEGKRTDESLAREAELLQKFLADLPKSARESTEHSSGKADRRSRRGARSTDQNEAER